MNENCDYICLHVALVLNLAAVQGVEGCVMTPLQLAAGLAQKRPSTVSKET